ncbi:MAG: NAD(P)H-dependent oxidoreductase [Sarcina sp.]
MKKILYISVNSKSEEDSASKTVARELINKLLDEGEYKECKKENEENIDYKEHKKEYQKECECECHKVQDKQDEKIDKGNKEVCCEHKTDIIDKIVDDVKVVCESKYNVETKKINDNDEKHINNDIEKTKCEVTDMSSHKATNENINSDIKDEKNENYDGNIEKNINDFCRKDDDEKFDQNLLYENSDSKENDNKEALNEEKYKVTESKIVDEEPCCDKKNEKQCDEKDEKCCGEKILDFIHNGCDKDNTKCDNTIEFELEEIDLFKEYIPVLTHEYYECRNTIVGKNNSCYDELSDEKKKDIDRIKELANKFKEADIYIIAAPMWSMLFPSQLKAYLDCVLLNDVTVEISRKGCRGLLDDKIRKMVFVQSVGGELPILLKSKIDHSSSYLKDIAKFLGIAKFEELLVDGTGYTQHEKEDAIEEAVKDISHIVKMLVK